MDPLTLGGARRNGAHLASAETRCYVRSKSCARGDRGFTVGLGGLSSRSMPMGHVRNKPTSSAEVARAKNAASVHYAIAALGGLREKACHYVSRDVLQVYAFSPAISPSIAVGLKEAGHPVNDRRAKRARKDRMTQPLSGCPQARFGAGAALCKRCIRRVGSERLTRCVQTQPAMRSQIRRPNNEPQNALD